MADSRRQPTGDLSRARVIDAIRGAAEISRVELARITGLTAAAISGIVRELIDTGWVLEVGFSESTGGKRRTLLQLNAVSRHAIGILIDGSRLLLVVTDLAGHLVGRLSVTGVRWEASEVAAEIDRLLVAVRVGWATVVGIGIAAGPPPMHPEPGEQASDLDQISREGAQFALAERLEALCGVAVSQQNHAVCAAVGEYWTSQLDPVAVAATIYVGDEITGSFLLDGSVFRGSLSTGGDLGHLSLDIDGPSCSCGGRGCLRLYARPEAVAVAALADAELVEELGLDASSDGRAVFRIVGEAARRDHAASTALIRGAASRLGAAVVALSNIMDLDEVCLAGPGFAEAGAVYAQVVAERVHAIAVSREVHPVVVRLSRVGLDAAAIGAAALMLQRSAGRTAAVPPLAAQTSRLMLAARRSAAPGGRPVTDVLSLASGRGPRTPPSSRPASGLFTATPLRYGGQVSGSSGPSDAELRAELPTGPLAPGWLERADIEAIDISPGTRLVYAVYPEHGSRATNMFAACGLSVDVVWDDGEHSTDLGLTDQHEFAVDAASQASSKTLLCDQWNLKIIDLSSCAGRRIDRLDIVLATGSAKLGTRVDESTFGWLDGLHFEIASPYRASTWAVDLVDTRRGSHSSVCIPAGERSPPWECRTVSTSSLRPRARTPGWLYAYHRHDVAAGLSALQAFSLTHQASTWMGDHGVLQLMPATSTPHRLPAARALSFRHTEEEARPYVYRVRFDEGIQTAMSATSHAAAFTFAFPEGQGSIVMDQLTSAGSLWFDDAPAGLTFSGQTVGDGREQRMYFAGRSDQTPVGFGHLDAERWPEAGYLRFAGLAGAPVTVQLATSFISLRQAWANLRSELDPDASADDVADQVAACWERRLGAVEVTGATEDQLTTFYSCLYRMFLYPNTASEDVVSNGQTTRSYSDFTSPSDLAVRPGEISVNNGFWDTYRTVWPALCLFQPDEAGRLLDGFVEHFRVSGWTPRWSAPEAKDCMVGTSSDLVFADAAVNGIPFDVQVAYDSALHNATVPSTEPSTGRKGLERGIFVGYIDQNIEEGLSWSLENAIADFGITQFANVMVARADPADPRISDYRAEAAYFARRAAGFRLLFEQRSGFFRGREHGGGHPVEQLNPALWGGDYTETNAWGMAFTVPHDGAGLAALYGGPAGLEAKLDAFFETAESGAEEVRGGYPTVIHEMTEAHTLRMGMFGLNNQPAHHIPWMYAFTGAPHKAQRRIRDALVRGFTGSEIGQGYPGDEDNGEMSAWYVLSALGLYPLVPASGGFVFGAPLFATASIQLPGGMLRVIAHRADSSDCYIRRVLIDGAEWSSTFVSTARLAAGPLIEIELAPEPTDWGHEPQAQPPSHSDDPRGRTPWIDLTCPGGRASASGFEDDVARLFDDDSTLGVRSGADAHVTYELEDPTVLSMYTLTAAAGEMGWRLEGALEAEWTLLDERRAEHFRWDRQTRPFLLAPHPPVRYLRLTVGPQPRTGPRRGTESGCIIYQVEYAA